MQTNKKNEAKENKPERAYVKNMERNGDNTHTMQRLQAYHQSQQLMLLKPLMPCSTQPHETPTNSTSNMTINDMQIPISGQKCSHQRNPKILKNPPKKNPTHLIKNTTQTTLINLEKGDWNVHW